MKKFSQVFKSIRFAKMDPKHEKGHKGPSLDDELHYAVGEKEWEQQVKHAKKRAMQEDAAAANMSAVQREKTQLMHMKAIDKKLEYEKERLRKAKMNLNKEEIVNEISDVTVKSYKEKSESQVKELKPFTKKGEYKDIAKNMVKRRESGLKMASSRLKEDIEIINEKNEPTNPELWARAKSLAKSKFDIYPSAYANGWASKWYKEKGGGWKSVKEESSIDETQEVIEESRKVEIIKNAYKKSKEKFEKEPVISDTVVKADMSTSGQ